MASSVNVTDEVIMEDVEERGLEPPDGDFKVDEELFSRLTSDTKLPPLGGSNLFSL